MNHTPKNRAIVVSSAVRRPVVTQWIVADDSKAVQVARIHRAIMAELQRLNAPFLTPEEIASRLGIKPNSFRIYCRQTKALRNWSGSYRFMTDDAEHIQAMSDVVLLALWSMKRLPDVQKVQAH